MTFEYNQHYKTPVVHKGIEFWNDPRIIIPATEDMPAQSYADYYEMTEADVEEIILKASWQQIRDIRNLELAKSDWTQVSDVPDAIKLPWQVYRAQLRDLPESASTPAEVEWPTKPE
jgi:hypothetical protein